MIKNASFARDPYNDLLQSLYSFIAGYCIPLCNPTYEGFFLAQLLSSEFAHFHFKHFDQMLFKLHRSQSDHHERGSNSQRSGENGYNFQQNHRASCTLGFQPPSTTKSSGCWIDIQYDMIAAVPCLQKKVQCTTRCWGPHNGFIPALNFSAIPWTSTMEGMSKK